VALTRAAERQERIVNREHKVHHYKTAQERVKKLLL
jgi:hypothetical protein